MTGRASSCLWGERLADERGEVGLEGRLGLRTDDGLDDLTVLEHLHRGDGGDLVGRSRLGVLVNVQLDDLDLVAVLFGDLVEDRADSAAGTTPLCPEVNEDGFAAVEHVGLKAGVGHGFGHGFAPCGVWKNTKR